MKTQLTLQDISVIFLTVTSICVLKISDFVYAHEPSMWPKQTKNTSEVIEMITGTGTEIDQLILSQEDRTMKKNSSKSRNHNLPESQIVIQAKKDLAHRLSVEVDLIHLLEARRVTWPDSSFGCPEPGKVYSQVLQDGLLIRLEAEGRMYFYHSGGGMDPFLCEQTSRIVPRPTGGDEFVPPPGSEID